MESEWNIRKDYLQNPVGTEMVLGSWILTYVPFTFLHLWLCPQYIILHISQSTQSSPISTYCSYLWLGSLPSPFASKILAHFIHIFLYSVTISTELRLLYYSHLCASHDLLILSLTSSLSPSPLRSQIWHTLSYSSLLISRFQNFHSLEFPYSLALEIQDPWGFLQGTW